ncbi:MAG: bis(5'-nucleosyl)-tetraphosphatase (symmetrical) YqeK [Clostridia bacterium]|nr:bis(5'-nucleosyl)-tetraphosphatase (symmetrical) YqeK [Clostridia bacterium]
MDEEALRAALSRRLSPARLAHVERVAATAAVLARRFGVDEGRARVAAWLHDIAREMAPGELAAMARRLGVPVRGEGRALVALTHGPVAAALAATEWRVDDPEVLAAIAHHTTGAPGMSRLEKVLFVADYIEPGRNFPGVEEVRRLAGEDLDRATEEALRQTMAYLEARGEAVAPETLAALEELEERRPESG